MLSLEDEIPRPAFSGTRDYLFVAARLRLADEQISYPQLHFITPALQSKQEGESDQLVAEKYLRLVRGRHPPQRGL